MLDYVYDAGYLTLSTSSVAVADPGEGTGGASSPPLFLDQTEARRAETIFFRRPASPLSKGLNNRTPPPARPVSRSRSGTVLFCNKFCLLFLLSALQIRFRCQGYLEGFFTIQQIGMCDVVICHDGRTSGKRPHRLRRVSGRLR